MIRATTVAAAVLLSVTSTATAVIISMIQEDDPFAAATCTGIKLRSEAPYVFKDWPATFDLIEWPQHDPNEFLACENSGYTALPGDFGPLSAEEKARIAPYLKQAAFGPQIQAAKRGPTDAYLAHLERIYALRDKSEVFRAYLARYLASQWNDPSGRAAHQQAAFDRQLKLLNSGTLDQYQLLDALYIVGYYAWQLNRKTESESYFARLKATTTTSDSEQSRKAYLEGLVGMIKEGIAGKPDRAFMQPPRAN